MKLPDDFLAALGRVVATWSIFEHNLGQVTMLLVTSDIDTGIAVVKELRFRALADAALNVYRAHIGEDDDFKKLAAIITRAEKLEVERNRFAHGTFSPIEPDFKRVSIYKVSAKRKGIKRIIRAVETSELDALAERIEELSKDLWTLFHKIVADGKTKYVRMHPPQAQKG